MTAHLAGSILPDDGEANSELDIGRMEALPHREYSIASIAHDGRVELLVRQVRNAGGGLGLGSGWLTEHAAIGATIDLRIRANPGFAPVEDHRPLVLIGNGTGLAGLLAHLRHRAYGGGAESWLFFGERSRDYDAFHDAELQAQLSSGCLSRLDRTWSRDAACGQYVQQRLDACSDDIRAWIDRGAAIFICGSLDGMAPAVDPVLRGILGDGMLETLAEEGRYRRDIY